ncbi:hypothetical protein Nepgr_020274 [Nepenthes gracilis]|uniref:Reverse transcriptase domain-containing protein n=1 Tax=Nepenthes gracilis TaxID=150966 RepID=A0AAD3XV37_NEPGR|nr:hypothetical protein Nepgr_020274 [Nepenthes gracilis]
MSGHELLRFMDAYSGYNQIRIDPEDEKHTSFMTDHGTYCYKMMPFGLKNAGATYQCLVNKMFEAQIGRNVEVYVDDMLVKSKVTSNHISDLDETFQVLRRHGMKLNPAKCAFGVTSGKFLGFIVSQRGIEANPEKIKAILDLNPPRTIKEVQKLTGRVAALLRFLAKWNEECDEAFKELKTYLSSAPLLSSSCEGEDLYLYLATSTAALSSVLVREHEGRQQPVYYVSRVLTDVETRYPHAEKMALALIYAARKLLPYFQSHWIVVLTDQPLKSILQKPKTSRRLALAVFIVEAATPAQEEDDNPGSVEDHDPPAWTLNVDGSSTQIDSGAGVVLRTPEGMEIAYSVTLAFPATNNVKGNFDASNPQLARYLVRAKALIPEFGRFVIEHIPRSDNERADRLAWDAAARSMEQYAREPREVLTAPSIDAEDKEVLRVHAGNNWMTPYVKYLIEGTPARRHR